jgi:hypothetical protein
MGTKNGLTKAQEERLHHLIEECSEVIKEACKILHHGYNSYNPNDLVPYPNRVNLEMEASQVLSMLVKMDECGDINFNLDKVKESLPRLWDKKKKWCHYQDE